MRKRDRERERGEREKDGKGESMTCGVPLIFLKKKLLTRLPREPKPPRIELEGFHPVLNEWCGL